MTNNTPNNTIELSRPYMLLWVARVIAQAQRLVREWKKTTPFHGALDRKETPIGRIADMARLLHDSAKNGFKHHNQLYVVVNEMAMCQNLEIAIRDFWVHNTASLKAASDSPVASYVGLKDIFSKKARMPKNYSGTGVDFEERSGHIESRAR